MLAIAVLLLVLGAADLAASGLDGEPVRSAATGGLGALAAGAVAVVALGATPDALVAVTAALVVAGGWLVLRARADDDDPARDDPTRAAALLALAWLAAGIGLAGFLGALTDPVTRGWLTVLAGERGLPPATLLLVGGGVAVQFATGNAVVRLVLRLAGGPVSATPGRLRAGRVVGVLERLLVFGAIAAGQVGIAGAAVAAKGLLRYPEVAAAARRPTPSPPGVPLDVKDDPVPLTEYLLVGTLTSVLVAAAPALAV